MDSTDLREQIHAMLAAGLKQRQIAAYLGIGQATVSDHKRALVAAGRLSVSRASTRCSTGADVVDLLPARQMSGRNRAEILLEHADLKATTLRAAARTLAEHVVGADEWVTDPAFREQVRAVVADAVVEAIDHLERITAELGTAEAQKRRTSAGPRGTR